MRKLIITAAAALIAGPLFAQGHYYVGPQLSLQMLDEDRFISNLDENTLQLGLNVGYQLSSAMAFELMAQTSIKNSGTDVDAIELGYYTFFSENEDGYRPYMLTALGYTKLGNSAANFDDETYSVVVGLGLSKYLSEAMEFRTDVRIRSGLADAATGPIAEPGLSASLNYHFGDTDTRPAQAPVAAPARQPVQAPVAAPAPRPAPVARPAPAPEPEPVMRNVTVALDVLFANNSSVLEDVDVAEFSRMADALADQTSTTLVIEGYTDSRGSAEYNETLSQRRADSVRQELIDAYGAPANRIRAIGYGEANPIADNETAAGRAQNRRVIGVITYQVAQ